MRLLFLSCLLGFLTEASVVLDRRSFDEIFPRRAPSLENSDLMVVPNEEGGLDIVEKSQYYNATGLAPDGLTKRSSWPGDLCREFGGPGCDMEAERIQCIDKHTYQAFCAGCFNRDKARYLKKNAGQACYAFSPFCITTQAKNAWGELADYVACLPNNQATTWQAAAHDTSPSPIRSCSGPIRNTLGRNVKVELHEASYNSNGQYLITSQRMSFALDKTIIADTVHTAIHATALILRAGSFIRGCITPDNNANQVLQGRVGVEFL